MYESPIEKIVDYVQSQLVESEESELMTKITQTIGYHIDKDELIRALQYDRQQYEKGYADGVADAKPRWVPVSEKLPEEGCYFVSMLGRYIGIDKYTKGKWLSGQKIDAWMTVPAPYKPQESEG